LRSIVSILRSCPTSHEFRRTSGMMMSCRTVPLHNDLGGKIEDERASRNRCTCEDLLNRLLSMVSDANVATWNAKLRCVEPAKQTLMQDSNSQAWWPLSLSSFQLASTCRCIVAGVRLYNESGRTYRSCLSSTRSIRRYICLIHWQKRPPAGE
jgi:hypothetical protein